MYLETNGSRMKSASCTSSGSVVWEKFSSSWICKSSPARCVVGSDHASSSWYRGARTQGRTRWRTIPRSWCKLLSSRASKSSDFYFSFLSSPTSSVASGSSWPSTRQIMKKSSHSTITTRWLRRSLKITWSSLFTSCSRHYQLSVSVTTIPRVKSSEPSWLLSSWLVSRVSPGLWASSSKSLSKLKRWLQTTKTQSPYYAGCSS